MSVQKIERKRLLMNGSTMTDNYPSDLLNRELYITKSGYLVSKIGTSTKPIANAYANRISKPDSPLYTGSSIIDIGYKLTGSGIGFESSPVFQVGGVSFNFTADRFETLKTKKLSVSTDSYGTTLPGTGVEGQIFFKVIE